MLLLGVLYFLSQRRLLTSHIVEFMSPPSEPGKVLSNLADVNQDPMIIGEIVPCNGVHLIATWT